MPEEHIETALEDILGSSVFKSSKQCQHLLRYIVKYSLQDRDELLRERIIGVSVFGRSLDYDTGNDPVVRARVAEVRKRLAQYYQGHRQVRALISIPKGSYKATFSTECLSSPTPELKRDLEQSEGFYLAKDEPPAELSANITELWGDGQVLPKAEPVSTTRSSVNSSDRRWLRYTVGALTLFSIGALLWWSKHQFQDAAAISPSSALWRTLLSQGPPTIFVPGDAELVIAGIHTHRRVPLSDYMTRRYVALDDCSSRSCSPALETTVAQRHDTSIVDTTVGIQLARLSDTRHPFQVRYARDVRIDELQNNNVVLCGGELANPWVTMYQDHLNFYLKSIDNNYEVVNRSPQKGESDNYLDSSYVSGAASYGLISYLPNIAGTGRVLILQGTTQAGTEAAVELVLNPKKLDAILLPHVNGRKEVPSFEILIKTENLDDSSPSSELLATRFR